MAVRARHTKTSGVADSGDTNLVQPSDWNADHPITADGPGIVGRTTAGAGAVAELDAPSVRSFLGQFSGVATVTIAQQLGALEHTQTVSAPGVTPSSHILVSLAPAQDTDENDPELLDVTSLWAAPGTDQITIGVTFAVPASGPILINWSAF